MNQRSDHIEAKHTCKQLYHEHTAITGSGNKPILLHSTSDNDVEDNLKASKNTITDLNLVQDGGSTLPPDQHLRLRHRTGSNMTIGIRIKVGILGEPHPGLNSFFEEKMFRDVISLAGNLISQQSTECVDRYT